MLGVVVNESNLIKAYINNKETGKNPMETIGMLIKYYYLKDMNDEQIYQQIIKYLEDVYKEKFIFTKWDIPVRNAIKRFHQDRRKYKIDVKMNDIENIEITENELGVISALENSMLEKIAFVMLVYAKISNIQMNNKESWINKSCSMICKEAKISLRGDEQKRIFNELYKKQYIKMSNNNEKNNMKINYLDNEGEIGITINNFEGIVYYYLVWKGENWKRCECCDKKWFKPKSNNDKNCNTCKIDIREEQNREKSLKYYYKTKTLPS